MASGHTQWERQEAVLEQQEVKAAEVRTAVCLQQMIPGLHVAPWMISLGIHWRSIQIHYH